MEKGSKGKKDTEMERMEEENTEKKNAETENNLNKITTEESEKEPEKKSARKSTKNFRQNIRNTLRNFIQIFKEYPLTIGGIVLAAFLGTLLIDADFDESVYEVLIKTCIGLCFFADGALLAEELFRREKLSVQTLGLKKHWIFKGIMLFVAAAVSYFTIFVLDNCENWFADEFDGKYFAEHFMRFVICYYSVLFIASVYMMYKRLKVAFERYFIDVFAMLIKTTVVYAMFALGISGVIGIFDLLIYNLEKFHVLARVNLFLAAGIYYPAVIIVISDVRKEIGKFAKIVSEYVLLPIFIAACAIFYVYTLKLIFSRSLPANRVFTMLSVLFACGMPIWTMAMNFKEQVLGKIARILPFVFVPFIIIQGICMGIRIADCGVTVERYMGIMLIVIEIVYVALYAVRFGKYIDLIVPIVTALTVAVVLLPGINVWAVSTRSQAARFERYMNKADELTDEEKKAAGSIYRTLGGSHGDCGVEGEKYLRTNYSEDLLEEVSIWYYGYYVPTNYEYYSSWATLNAADIAGYNYMIRVSCRFTKKDNGGKLIDNARSLPFVSAADKTEYSVVLDMEDIFRDMIKGNVRNYLKENNMFTLKDGRAIFIENMYLTMDGDDYYEISVEGYLFEAR